MLNEMYLQEHHMFLQQQQEHIQYQQELLHQNNQCFQITDELNTKNKISAVRAEIEERLKNW